MFTKITLKCHSCKREFIRYSDTLTTNGQPNEIKCPYCFSTIEYIWLKDIVNVINRFNELNSNIYHKNNSIGKIGYNMLSIPFTISLEPCLSPKDIETLNSKD